MARINNGIKHCMLNQQYATQYSNCTFFYPSDKNENKIKAVLLDKNILMFNLKEKKNILDIFIKIPTDFECIHYKKGKINRTETSTENTHLSYHGTPKRKKISGQIHIKHDDVNSLKSEADKTQAPLANSSDIEKHPLPICRIELSDNIKNIKDIQEVDNYFFLDSDDCFFNTIEVHLAKKGYMKNLVSVKNMDNEILHSIFVYGDFHMYFTNKLELKYGRFPQVLVVQSNSYELIIVAGHYIRHEKYTKNKVHYFYTKDYYKELLKRSVIMHNEHYFIQKELDGTKFDTSIKTVASLLPV